jgi:hypothetical protein
MHIRSADPRTHIKIVVVSLVTAAVVVVIGFNARTVGINADTPVVTKVGKAVIFSTKDIPTVR